MSRSVVRQFLTLMLILGVPCTHAADGSVVIEAPAEGATLKSKEKNHLVYAVNRGRKGDHVHVYVDGKEVATLHRTKGAYLLKDLDAGPREICIKVVNKGHTPIGLARCTKVTVE